MPQANVNSIQIEYETFGDKSSKPLLLIGGLGVQLIYWQDEFCTKIADQGYYVIRYDNRDTGLSTKFNEVGLTEAMEKIGALFMGEKVPVFYCTDGMACDVS